jgi:phosphoglycolate phosphatase-like HAD superfamily hydrolase
VYLMSAEKDTCFVFDMDGVILDSLDNLSNCLIKAIEPFCQSDEQYKTFSKYDKENPGLSRFEKTDFFVESFSNSSHIKTDRIKQQILDKFNSYSLDARLNSKIDKSAYGLPKKIATRNLVLLSNCDNTQLEVIAAHFGFHQIFRGGIIGTPPGKKRRFSDLVDTTKSSSFVSISDSESDAIIARSLNISFVFIQNFARDQALWLKDGEKRFQTIGDFIFSIDQFTE